MKKLSALGRPSRKNNRITWGTWYKKAPFNTGQSTFNIGEDVRNTVTSPLVNGMSLFVPTDHSQQTHIKQGYINITQAPYSADNTGVVDCTTAFNNALEFCYKNHLVLYVPSGTYRVTDTIGFSQKSYLRDNNTQQPDRLGAIIMQGPESGTKPTIVLDNSAAGFGNSASPKPVVHIYGIGAEAPSTTELRRATFNNEFKRIKVVTGTNAGAVALRLVGAQGLAMHDVDLDATGGYACIQGGQGGGAMHGKVSCVGGQYGMHLDGGGTGGICPVYNNFTISGFSVSAIILGNDTQETTTFVGLNVVVPTAATGPALDINAGSQVIGIVNLIDSKIDFESPGAGKIAVDVIRSLHISNTFIRGAGVLVNSTGGSNDIANPNSLSDWTWIREVILPIRPDTITTILGAVIQTEMHVWKNGSNLLYPGVEAIFGDVLPNPPADLASRHVWQTLLLNDPSNIGDIKSKYGIVGDGITDDYLALQRAIDLEDIVRLPKGYYKVSKTLNLRSTSKIIGLSKTFSVIFASDSPGGSFDDPANAEPILQTPSDSNAEILLHNIGIYSPMEFTGSYTLNWRAGDKSILMNVSARLFFKDGFVGGGTNPARTGTGLIKISGSGGGKFYNLFTVDNSPSGTTSNYSALVVDNISNPLRFYHLDIEHTGYYGCSVRFNSCSNIGIFSLIGEENDVFTNQTPVLISNYCTNLNIFGTGNSPYSNNDDGSANPPACIHLNMCNNFKLTNVIERGSRPRSPYIIMINEQVTPGSYINTGLLNRPAYYSRNPGYWDTITYPRAVL